MGFRGCLQEVPGSDRERQRQGPQRVVNSIRVDFRRQTVFGSLEIVKEGRRAVSRRGLHKIYKKRIVLVAHLEEPCLDCSEDSEN